MHFPNRKIGQMRRVFFEELVEQQSNFKSVLGI